MTFEEKGGKTLLVLHELHPSKEAPDEAIGFGEGLRETFGQLDELVLGLGASAGESYVAGRCSSARAATIQVVLALGRGLSPVPPKSPPCRFELSSAA